MGGDKKSMQKKKFVPTTSDKKRAALVKLAVPSHPTVPLDEFVKSDDRDHDKRKLAVKLKALNLSQEPAVSDTGVLVRIEPSRDELGKIAYHATADNVPYLQGLMLRTVVTGEIYRNITSVESYDESICARSPPGKMIFRGYSRYKPSAYIPNDPMVLPESAKWFVSPVCVSFFSFCMHDNRTDYLFGMAFHNSLIRLLEMVIVMREVYALTNFGTDWSQDCTDGVHAAGLVDLPTVKGKSIMDFRSPPIIGAAAPSVRLSRSVNLLPSDDIPDAVAGMLYPAGSLGNFLVHPVLDYYLQRHYATFPYDYEYSQDSVFTHIFGCRPLEYNAFHVNGDPVAAHLIREQYSYWIGLVCSSFVWANYVTIHLESKFYTHAPFAVWRALELLGSYTEHCQCRPSFRICMDVVQLPDWQGEAFFQFPRRNSLK